MDECLGGPDLGGVPVSVRRQQGGTGVEIAQGRGQRRFGGRLLVPARVLGELPQHPPGVAADRSVMCPAPDEDRKSTRLNSSHVSISYAVFCLKKKKNNKDEE